MSTILEHMVWPYCAFRMQVWNSCTHLIGNAGPKKSPKSRDLGTIIQLCQAISLQLRYVSTIRKKLVKQQCLPQISSQYGEHRRTSRWDLLASLGHPSTFQRVFASWQRTAATSLTGGLTNFARCLVVTWAGRLYIHFRQLLYSNGILPRAKFTLRPPTSLALFYWQRYCTALEQWAQAKLYGIEHRAPPIFGRATITLGIGPHSSFIWTLLKWWLLW